MPRLTSARLSPSRCWRAYAALRKIWLSSACMRGAVKREDFPSSSAYVLSSGLANIEAHRAALPRRLAINSTLNTSRRRCDAKKHTKPPSPARWPLLLKIASTASRDGQRDSGGLQWDTSGYQRQSADDFSTVISYCMLPRLPPGSAT